MLYVRNETNFAISANQVGAARFELAPKGNAGDSRVVPAAVAALPGFQRLVAATAPSKVTLSQNANFSSPITAVPASELAPVTATTAAAGLVKQGAAQADSAATTAAGVVTDLNALLAKLRTAGILAP